MSVHLQEGQDASGRLQHDQDLPEPPTREEMLEAVPLHVAIADDVDLDAEDPALTPKGRRCIAVRQAGGRCTAPPPLHSLLCNPHAGLLDASEGGRAAGRKKREARYSAEEQARLARLGTRGVIAARLAARHTAVARTIDVLLDASELGDVQAAKLLIPYLNQGLGMPTERVEVAQEPTSREDLASLTTAELEERVAERRARRLAAVPDLAVEEQADRASG